MEIQGPDFVASRKTKSRMLITIGTDDESFSISVLPPTKRIIGELIDVSAMLEKASDDNASSADLGVCLDFAAKSMSHNSECRKVTVEYLEGIGFDITDIGEYVGAYLTFVGSLASGKN